MAIPAQVVDAAMEDAARARRRIARMRGVQVRGQEERTYLRAVAHTWFHTHRPALVQTCGDERVTAIDNCYRSILDAADGHTTRRTYAAVLRQVCKLLQEARGTALLATSAIGTEDTIPPDFSPLVGNAEMRDILTRRWHECQRCVAAEAHLAAIVMMGGFLEALFVARANRLPDKEPLLAAKSAPRDKTTSRVVKYQDWMLDSYIQVAHELGWITDSARRLADVLKEYRNYVHPEKERRHGVVLALNDSAMFWQVTMALTRQLLQSARAAAPSP
jgi:hypothetical protein